MSSFRAHVFIDSVTGQPFGVKNVDGYQGVASKFVDADTGLSFGVTNIGGRQGVSTRDFLTEVTLGNIPGASKFSTNGYNSGLSVSAQTTIWTLGTNYYWLPSAQILKVSSTSVNDTAAGTGARLVQITGLTGTGWLEESEVVSMNGTTPVSTTKSYRRIWQALVLDCGSGGTNAGQIYVRDNADTNAVAHIDVGDGFSNMGTWSVPGNKTAYITSFSAATNGTKDALGVFMIRFNILSMFGFSPPMWQTAHFNITGSSGQQIFIPNRDFPPMTDFDFTAQASLANTYGTVTADFWYM